MSEESGVEKFAVPLGRRVVEFHTTDKLVAHADWHIVLQKTGYTTEAGKCLVMKAIVESRTRPAGRRVWSMRSASNPGWMPKQRSSAVPPEAEAFRGGAGSPEAFSPDADYRLNRHVDAYLGASTAACHARGFMNK